MRVYVIADNFFLLFRTVVYSYGRTCRLCKGSGFQTTRYNVRYSTIGSTLVVR